MLRLEELSIEITGEVRLAGVGHLVELSFKHRLLNFFFFNKSTVIGFLY